MRILLPIFFYFFILHGLFNFERIFYINEVFSAVGIFFYFFRFYLYGFKQDIIILSLNFLILYATLLLIFSLFFNTDSSVYEFLRTTTFYYSIFSFYLGIEFYKLITSRNLFLIKDIFTYPLIYLSSLGWVITSFAILPIIFFKKKIISSFIIIGLLLIYSAITSGMFLTVILTLVFFIFFVSILKSLSLSRLMSYLLIFGGFFIFLFSLRVVGYIYNDFFYINDAFQNIFPSIDPNLIWRLMFWAYLLDQYSIYNSFAGIGFGTKLFDSQIAPSFIYFQDMNRVLSSALEYTLGPHNSFFYIFIRLGIVGLLPILVIFSEILYRFYSVQYKTTLNIFLMASFLLVSIAALFNVVLASPLYASVFWIITGMVFQGTRIFNRTI